ncbi:DNA-directed RNA polymerase subunit delta [Pediococcus acidilactici]|uniref:DNA-directed RNA polymerase subunit delta n=1 Tax=Pediococcus acidilactici TaxID=1254 RepID=UPI000FFCCBD0|nr:DNA-directed RNA polymerase subunit delta [Pediococcus acidilactici]KAF0494502.1 DNA-directed RNA polymerase subunit delta [Pediococcus acidilactici]MCJ2191275.1 DNA-directed RNA polymerase subunit delta [Pediococcus acidilactici]MWB53908.1 DNA-directed RNA polymerase subunit delta [Pediococcus acidilactici]QAR71605.1 DNA-directed RNA polymerase subunit delta [Pediococcus acidilactici]
MELEIFKGQNKDELSMIEVAHAILAKNGEPMAFVDLANAVQNYLEKTDEEFRNRLSQFYTDLNIDGSFISLGENTWGLRTWYPFESIDEALIHTEEDEDRPVRKKRKRVNAFLADAADDDDVIDYDADDPEDEDVTAADDADADDPTYEDLSSDDDNDTLPDGIEGQLTELNDDEEE